MNLTTLIVLRSLERILAILIGCIFSYLGYRLFLSVPAKQNSEGELSLPSGASIHLLRVGPGVFFSLFGASIILATVIQPINYKEEFPTTLNISTAEPPPARKVEFLGASTGETVDTERVKRREQRNLRQRDIAVLNRLEDQLRSDLDTKQRTNIEISIPRIKLALMESVWIEEDWGSYADFRKAIETNERNAIENQAAIKYYDQK